MAKSGVQNFASISPLATARFAAALARRLKPGAVLALRGPLGSGKTTFVKGLARALGVSTRVKSPSFVVAAPYPVKRRGIKNFYHFDLYRLRSGRELGPLGFREIIRDRGNIVAIEWPEVARRLLPGKTRYLNFKMGNRPSERQIRIWSKN